MSQLIPEETIRHIDVLQQAIGRVHEQLAEIDRRVDEIALTQLSDIEIDGVAMRAQKMAELVVSGEAQHHWFDDVLSLAPEHAPPLSDTDAARVRECRRKLGADLVYVEGRIPSADDLPSVEMIVELHHVLTQMRRYDALVNAGEVLALKSLTHEVITAARELLADVEHAKALAEELETFGEPWVHDLRAKCRLPAFAAEREALEALFQDVERLIAARAEFLKR